MVIAQVTPIYPPKRGGIGTVAERYTHQLSDLGHVAEVFEQSSMRALFRYGHAAILPQLMWRLRGFDVIHLHYPFYGGAIFAVLASIIWRVPLIVTYHMKTKASGWLGVVFRLQRSLVEPFILKRAEAVLVSSKDYAESVGLVHSNLVEMPFGIDTEEFAPQGEPDQRSIKTILFVGGLDDAHYFKGVDVLLEACSRLDESSWHLEIVGDGNRKPAYQKLASTLGIEDRVTFRGKLSEGELRAAYRNADLHVLPAIDRSEAFGLVTLEAAASGTPSIVSDLPGVRTLVDHGQTGLIVEPKNVSSLFEALQEIIADDQKCVQYGQAARERVLETYDERTLAKKLIEIYERARILE